VTKNAIKACREFVHLKPMSLSSSALQALKERITNERIKYNNRKSDKTRVKDLAHYKEQLAFHEEQLVAQSTQRRGAPRRALASYNLNHVFMKRFYRAMIKYVEGRQAAAAQPAAAQPVAAEPAAAQPVAAQHLRQGLPMLPPHADAVVWRLMPQLDAPN
jgi:hypothetical protein